MKTKPAKSFGLHSWISDASNGFNQLEMQRVSNNIKVVDEHYSDKFEVLACANESKAGFINKILKKVGER